MNLSKIEKKVLEQLAANGAATVHELTEAIACSLSGVQSAMRTLRAANLIRQGDLKHVPGLYKRHRMYVTNTTHTIADENPLLDRVVKMEAAVNKIIQMHNKLATEYCKYVNSVPHSGEENYQLARRINDNESRLSDLENRIRALEPAVVPVDPIYAEIEEWVRTTLGGKDVPEEALRSIIDDVYEKRTK